MSVNTYTHGRPLPSLSLGADVRRDLWFLALLFGALGVARSVGFLAGGQHA